MGLQTKAFFLQMIGFVIFFLGFRFLVDRFTGLEGIWVPLTAFLPASLLSPKFRAIQTPDGKKIFMRWIFLKGVREV